MLVPFIWMILTAFKTVTEATSVDPFTIFPKIWRKDAFISVINNMNFLLLYKNTLLLTDHLEYCQDHGDNKKYYYDRSAVSHVLIDKCIFIEQINQ